MVWSGQLHKFHHDIVARWQGADELLGIADDLFTIFGRATSPADRMLAAVDLVIGTDLKKGTGETSERIKALRQDRDSVRTNAVADRPRAERPLPSVSSFEQARNVALQRVGDLGSDSRPYRGTMNHNEGTVVGRQSADGLVRWRLDYDPIKGPHINIEDFRPNGGKWYIRFDGDQQTYNSYLRQLQR